MTTSADHQPAPGQTVDAIGACRVLRDVRAQPGIDTLEGTMRPLMGGLGIRSHVIEMHPGQETP